ncbi:MAG TPA: condensation domain-containing protein, partial [Pyrinomonadaceae bacterium]
FVNALPARVRLPLDGQVVPWLRDVQKQQAEARRFEFCSLVRIQGWSEVPRTQPLFESVVIFQNFPVMASIPESAGVQVVGVSLVERSNLPLAFVVEPGAQFLFRVIYMANRFDDSTVDRILENFQRILVELATKPDALLSTIFSEVDNERQSLIDSFNQSLATL